MKRFARLLAALDQTTGTSGKVVALADYIREAPEEDRLWMVALLSGRRPKRSVTAARLREWAAEAAGLPDWLFEECHAVAGDLAETIALSLPPPEAPQDLPLAHWLAEVQALAALPEAARKPRIRAAWSALGGDERFLFNKLLTGSFRVGVSQTLMTRALAQATGIAEPDLAHRLTGNWSPERSTWAGLILTEDPTAELSRPYPFHLATQIEGAPDDLGPPGQWFAEWKWDGLRVQLIRRGARHFVWSRGGELITDRFPEFAALCDWLPDGTVIDGEVLAFAGGHPLPFAALQKRLGRKTLPKRLLAEAPALLMAYDLLEAGGTDLRAAPFATRRARLAALCAGLPAEAPLRLSPEAGFAAWADLAATREAARAAGAEGLMLKRRAAPYLAGRKTGDWWTWKLDPMTLDAVMIYAQAGQGRRANLYTDFTFAVWDAGELVPVARADSGLTDAEFGQITAWVRKNTLERFGPVRRVTPEHVFEIACEGIEVSPRHKSGLALRFPRMLRWRHDKPIAEANTLDDLKALLGRG